MTHTQESAGSISSRAEDVEVVLFDLDGTLIDTIELILVSMRYATQAVLGEVLPDEVLMHNVGVPLAVQMAEFAPAHVDELLRVYRKHNAIVHDEFVAEFLGTADALAALVGKGLRLGVVTSKSGPVARRGLESFGLERFFETMVTYEDTEIHKPQPEPLLEAARRMGVDICSCAYVGDSPHDMTAAVAAGAVSFAALWGPFPQRVLEPGPDYAIGSLAELVDLVGGDGR